MTLQRRLSTMERDLAAIQAKLESLQSEAERLEEQKPEEAEAIKGKIAEINNVWMDLKDMVCVSITIKKYLVLPIFMRNVCLFVYSGNIFLFCKKYR